MAALTALCATPALAIDIDAGDYTALPAGTNVAVVYAQQASRDRIYAQGDRVPGEYGLDSTIGIARLIHFMKIGDYTVDPQVLLPFGHLEAKKDVSALGKGNGVGDVILAATVWTINEPAQRRYLGITPFLYAPTGNYDRNKALNLGENRWKYALQVGYIQGLSEKLTLDLAADATAYGRNDKANALGQAMDQKMSYQIQAFVRHDLRPGWDLRAGLSTAYSGSTTLGGVKQANGGHTSKFQLGSSYFLSPTTQLMANWGQDTRVDQGFKENSRFNLRLLQLF
jgi:hypothetical protein